MIFRRRRPYVDGAIRQVLNDGVVGLAKLQRHTQSNLLSGHQVHGTAVLYSRLVLKLSHVQELVCLLLLLGLDRNDWLLRAFKVESFDELLASR